MILHAPRKRPEPWQTQRDGLRHSWLVPLLAIEWVFEWIAFVLSRWSFLDVLEYLGSFSILVAVIFYFSESGDRLKQKHYQAWQVINTGQASYAPTLMRWMLAIAISKPRTSQAQTCTPGTFARAT